MGRLDCSRGVGFVVSDAGPRPVPGRLTTTLGVAMGLADDIYRVEPPSSAIDRVLAELDGDDADALRAALNDPTYPRTRLARVLGANGYPTDPKTIARWRQINGVG